MWAKRGSRPRAPRDRRYDWAYLFGAACPQRGVAAGLVMPTANAEAMSLHLEEISRKVAPGAHAVLVFDGAVITVPAPFELRTTSLCSGCRPMRPSSIRLKTSGSTYAPTSSPSPSSTTTTISSPRPAKPGTSSQTIQIASPQSQAAPGQQSILRAVGIRQVRGPELSLLSVIERRGAPDRGTSRCCTAHT